MSNMLKALQDAFIISSKQAQVMQRIQDRIVIINNQLDCLYSNPIQMEWKINQLEEQKGILENA